MVYIKIYNSIMANDNNMDHKTSSKYNFTLEIPLRSTYRHSIRVNTEYI